MRLWLIVASVLWLLSVFAAVSTQETNLAADVKAPESDDIVDTNTTFVPMAKYVATCKVPRPDSEGTPTSSPTEHCIDVPSHMPKRTLFWMHIQKTSSWLNNFLVVWACPTFCRDYLKENNLHPEDWNSDKPIFYDFDAIIKRRHIESMEAMTVFMKCSMAFKNFATTRFGWSQFGFHWPMVHESMKGNTITLFRKPMSRVISAYLFDMMLPQGFGTRTPEVKQMWRQYINSTDSPVYAYSQIPGIPNCQTKMVLGFRCGVPMNLTNAHKLEAVERVRNDFYFIGLTEESEASANLFLAMHEADGGLPVRKTLSDLTDPPFRFTHFRRNRRHSADNHVNYEQQMLSHGWKDEFDEAVYDAAARLFYGRCKQYNISTKHKTIEDLYAHPHRY